MPYLLERHKVHDYARWRAVFDADAAGRKTAGCRGARFLRNAEDPEEVIVLFEWDTLQRARQRIESATLGREFEEAGVSGGMGRTEFYLLEEQAPA
jgi:heme-degrading monooxygenase HmoA